MRDKGEKNSTGYEVRPFGRMRQLVIDGGVLAARRHVTHGLVEMDVTRARQILHEHKASTGESLSFAAFFAVCLGKAVDENRPVHAYRNWRNQLVLFEDVSVNCMVEVERGQRSMHLPHILKAVNRRTLRQIHDEIRAFQAGQARSAERKSLSLLTKLPAPLRRLFYRLVLGSPRLVKDYFGTVSLTSVGMFGKGGGWAIPFGLHTLSVALGGIAEKPGVVDMGASRSGNICASPSASIMTSWMAPRQRVLSVACGNWWKAPTAWPKPWPAARRLDRSCNRWRRARGEVRGGS